MKRLAAGGATKRLQQNARRLFAIRPLLIGLLVILLFAGWPVLVWEKKPLHDLAFSPDGRELATLGGFPDTGAGPAGRFELAVWNLSTRNKRLAVPLAQRTWQMAFAPDGRTLAVGDWLGRIELWDAASGRQRAAWPTDQSIINALAFTAKGDALLVAADRHPPRLWEVASGRLLATAPHAESGSKMSLQGEKVAVTHWEPLPSARITRLYDLSNNRFNDLGELNFGAVLLPDGQLVAHNDRGNVSVVDANSGRVICTGIQAFDIAISPVGNMLAVLDIKGNGPPIVELWDLLKGQRQKQLVDATSVEPQHGPGNYIIAFTSDGSRLAVANRAGSIEIWDVVTGKKIAELPGESAIRWQAAVLAALFAAWLAVWVLSGKRSQRRFAALADAAVINAVCIGLLVVRLHETGYPYDNGRPAMRLLLAFITAWLSLAVFWFVFGRTRWPWRLAGLVVAVSGAWAVLHVVIIEATPGWRTWQMTVGGAFFLAELLIVFGLFRRARLRLNFADAARSPQAPTQINLKDLLLWTAVLGGLFAVARQSISFPLTVGQWASFAAYAACVAVTAAAAVWSALGAANASLRFATLIAISLLCGFIASRIFSGPVAVPREWQTGLHAAVAAVVFGTLWVFRLPATR